METIVKVADFSASVVESSLIIYFLVSIFGVKKEKYKYVPAIITILIIAITINAFGKYLSVQTIGTLVVIIIYEFVFLKGKMVNKLIGICSIYIVIIIINMSIINLVSIITGIGVRTLTEPETGITRIIVLMLTKLLLFVVVNMISNILGSFKLNRDEIILMLTLFVVTLIVSIIMIDIMVEQSMSMDQKIESLFMIISLAVINVIAYAMLRKISVQHAYKVEIAMLNTQLEEQKHSVAKIDDLARETSKTRHDLKQYLTIILGLINTAEIDKAKANIESIIGEKLNNRFINYLSSSVVNSVLNDKQNTCIQQQIDFDIKVSGDIPEYMELEMGVLLSNLIENAIEAELQLVEGRDIRLEMYELKGMYFISVLNRISGSVLSTNPKLKTNKKNKDRHGIGLMSVKDIVEKFDGSYRCYEEKDYFITEISMKK